MVRFRFVRHSFVKIKKRKIQRFLSSRTKIFWTNLHLNFRFVCVTFFVMKIKRDIEGVVKRAAACYRVVTVMGPRQSGKTTLCRMAFSEKPYISLENPDVQERAIEDPISFLGQYRSSGVVLDEIQNAPELLSFIQGIVDEDDREGQFILTGSHQFSLIEGISQSLAGRTALIRLLPFSIAETEKIKSLEQLDEYIFSGFYPDVWNRGLEPTNYYRDYFETYVQRDLRQMIQIKNLRLFRNFVRLCAGRIGQNFNAANLANNLGVSSHTIQSWVSVLEASYILYLMEPFSGNIGKRLVKSPKLYFYDVGFAAYLLGFGSSDSIFTDRMRGALFENLVVMELLKGRYNQNKEDHLFFYRDKQQHEVDLLLKNGARFDAIEIKSSATFTKEFLKGLGYLKKVMTDSLGASFLVYAGEQSGTIGDVQMVHYKEAVQKILLK